MPTYVRYPFYRINSNVYLFGSIHCNKPNTIHPKILDIMNTCDELTLECDIKFFDDFDNEQLMNLICDDSLSIGDKLLKYYNANNYINPDKITKSPFYKLSAGFMYNESFLELLKNTTYFKNNLHDVKIEDIACENILRNQIQIGLQYGIDMYYANFYKLLKKNHHHLDESYSTFTKSYLYIHNLIFSGIIFFGRLVLGKNFCTNFDLNLHIDQQNHIKIVDKLKSHKIINNGLIIDRNIKWIPKIKKIIDDNNNSNNSNSSNTSSTKSLIIVGVGHIEDLMERLHELNMNYKIEKFCYFPQKKQ